MHQTRKEASRLLPIRKKGSKYIVRASSNLQTGIPIVIAVRDILKLAKTAKEVRKMIILKELKLNGRNVRDSKESMSLFNILEADKPYILSLLPTKKFTLVPTKEKNRTCKVINKKLIPGNRIQLNLHDGSNVITKDKINVEDSVSINSEGKIVSHTAFEKGKSCFIMSGKYMGFNAKITSVNGKEVNVDIKDKGDVKLNASQLIII
jgi:small subunit ribosomal protein S4e